MSFVGIIANPASGKDIRRLVAFGSVFDNQEKVRIVRRVLLGLNAVGVDQVCFMPDYFGIVSRAAENLKLNSRLFPVNFKARASQEDTIRAARIMEERGVDCIVSLGGDGTNRALVKGTASTPVLPLSTGTNNVFPYMIEGTLAGLAAALVARGLVPLNEASVRSTRLDVVVDRNVVDLALVDVAVYDDRFIGSRAVWDMSKVRQVVLNRAAPHSIGLSSIGGLIHPVKPEDPYGLNLVLGDSGRGVTAPIAPGLIDTIHLEKEEIFGLGQDVPVLSSPSVLALDGEREVELNGSKTAALRLSSEGPIIIDAARTMDSARKRHVLAPEISFEEAAGV